MRGFMEMKSLSESYKEGKFAAVQRRGLFPSQAKIQKRIRSIYKIRQETWET
jgi:hypothetical protein